MAASAILDERSGAAQEIAGLDAELSLDQAGEVLVTKGSLDWKGERITFDGKVASVGAAVAGERAQATLRVAGKLFELVYEGSAGLFRDPELDGTINIRAASAEALHAWLGRLRKGTGEAQPLTMTSRVTAANHRIMLADLSATLGDGSLSGALIVNSSGARPLVRGQLHLSELDLGRLLVRDRGSRPHRSDRRSSEE